MKKFLCFVCSMMMLVVTTTGVVVRTGCSKAPVGVQFQVSEKWTEELINWVVQWLEEMTGTEIEKGSVKITSGGARKAESGDGHVCDYQINVKYRQAEFPITAKDVPCNVDGKPTKEGEARIKDTIKGAKEVIKAIQ